jgi:hypothetical protein
LAARYQLIPYLLHQAVLILFAMVVGLFELMKIAIVFFLEAIDDVLLTWCRIYFKCANTGNQMNLPASTGCLCFLLGRFGNQEILFGVRYFINTTPSRQLSSTPPV